MFISAIVDNNAVQLTKDIAAALPKAKIFGPDGVEVNTYFDPTKGGYQYPPRETALRAPGVGTRYRITVNGPGVTPDILWQGPGFHDFDPTNPNDLSLKQRNDTIFQQLLGLDTGCHA